MSVRQQLNTAYGLSDSLLNVPLEPIISNRAPQNTDKAALGTLWVYRDQNIAYILTSVENNVATWVEFTDQEGAFTEYNVSTVDATPTALASFAMAASSAITVSGTVVATRADYSASLTGMVESGARRGAAGAPVAIGAGLIAFDEDTLGGNPAIDFAVVGNSWVLIVVGEVGTNWDWKAQLTTVGLP